LGQTEEFAVYENTNKGEVVQRFYQRTSKSLSPSFLIQLPKA